MQTVKLQAGEVLYRAGDISDKVYFIEAGEVEVRRVMDHQEVTVATLGKGQMLGEMGVVRNCIRSTTIVAGTTLTLASIDTNGFKEAFGGEKGVGLKLLRMICDRLCTTTEAAHVAGDPAHSGSVAGMQLLGASPELQSLLGVGALSSKACRLSSVCLKARRLRSSQTAWDCRWRQQVNLAKTISRLKRGQMARCLFAILKAGWAVSSMDVAFRPSNDLRLAPFRTFMLATMRS